MLRASLFTVRGVCGFSPPYTNVNTTQGATIQGFFTGPQRMLFGANTVQMRKVRRVVKRE